MCVCVSDIVVERWKRGLGIGSSLAEICLLYARAVELCKVDVGCLSKYGVLVILLRSSPPLCVSSVGCTEYVAGGC